MRYKAHKHRIGIAELIYLLIGALVLLVSLHARAS